MNQVHDRQRPNAPFDQPSSNVKSHALSSATPSTGTKAAQTQNPAVFAAITDIVKPSEPLQRASRVNTQALSNDTASTGMNPANTQKDAILAAATDTPSTNPDRLAAIPAAAVPTA